MDRVTKRIQPDVVLYAGKHKQYETSDIPAEVNSAGVREILQHLADYEDTGLEPEICAEYKKFEDEIVSKGVTFKHIVDLMEAEKDGRLIQLPAPASLHSLAAAISQTPAADVAPVVHGRWEWVGPYCYIDDGSIGTCSVCKTRIRFFDRPNYCPTCGAKMDAEG